MEEKPADSEESREPTTEPVQEPTVDDLGPEPSTVEAADEPVGVDSAPALSFGQRLLAVFGRAGKGPVAALEPAAEPVAEPEPAGAEVSVEVEQVGEPELIAPPGPTFRERLSATFAPVGGRLAPARDWLARGNWAYVAIGVLVVAALFLPPASLLQRLGLVGYASLNADNPCASHSDGISVCNISTDDGGLSGALAGAAGDTGGSLRVRLESVPMIDFLEGTAGAELRAAVEALPAVLQVKSPFYRVYASLGTDGPATIEVTIPNDAEPWETLDLYTWTGEAWEWVGGTLDEEREVLVAQVSSLPSSLVVMQTVPVVPVIGTVATEMPEGRAAEVVTEVLMPGLYLGTDGVLLGDPPTANEGGVPEVVPLIRNRREDQPLILALLNDVLTDAGIQQAHVDNIVAAAAGFGGVALDYQGVTSEQRDAFSTFVAALAEALHGQDMRLEVAVPAPAVGEEGWETGGYDWAALGAAADALLIPFPEDPADYAEDGEVASLLHWAVGQVNRYKLRAVVSSFSSDAGDTVRHIGLHAALNPFGQVQPPAEAMLEPGQEVVFTLAGQVTSITRNETAGTYAITYQAEDGAVHTIWLGTPSFLARKLGWALRYHLNGAVVADLTLEDNLPGVLEAVDGYRTAASPGGPTELQVAWTVEGSGGPPSEEVVALTQPDFDWAVPSEEGTYTVSAAIAGVSLGSVQLEVAGSASEPENEPTTITAEETACLQASFVRDVTVPDGTQFDNGEEFVKTWELRNSGTCDWPEETVLAFVSGSQMGGPDSVPVGEVTSGESVEISIDLVAPEDAGGYSGVWALKVGGTEISGSEVSVLIQAGEAAEASPPVVAPAPVSGGSFELGGHVRDTGMPYAGLMHYAGMNWTKIQVRYSGDATQLINTAHANNFKIQLSALGSPEMVVQPGFNQDYANWVAGLAAAGADAIEIWNEPNIGREWLEGYITPQAYTDLLCASYNAIKAASPGTAVISAAPAPTGWFGGCSPAGCDDQPWLEGLYAAGAANCMDYIGAHHNSGATSPSARTGHPADDGRGHHSWYFLPQTELYYNIFHGTRQLFYTEMGYASQEGVPYFSDQFAWARNTNNAQQAAWLAEAVQLSVNTGMVHCIIVWNIDFVRSGDDPQDGYAIIRPGGSCPACDSLHATLGTR